MGISFKVSKIGTRFYPKPLLPLEVKVTDDLKEIEIDHEEGTAGEREDLERCQGDGARVRVRVHKLHHWRSIQQVREGEAKYNQRRQSTVGHDHPRL